MSINRDVLDFMLDMRDSISDIRNCPVEKIAGMRDKLIHEYFGVDLRIIWETVQHDFTDLENAVEDFLDLKSWIYVKSI